jgi:hypothetical protein
MAGKRGRPRKETLRRNVELGDDEREEVKKNVLRALRGEPVGDMEPLGSKAFADLVIFVLGDYAEPNKGVEVGTGDEFSIE